MDLIAYLTLLRRAWVALLVCLLVGGGAGYAASYRSAPQYRSTASVFLSPGQGQSIGELAQGSSYTQGLVQSYVRLATTPAVLEPVIAQLGLDTSPQALAKQVTAEAQLDTVLIDITAVSGSATGAAAIANAVGEQLSRSTEALSPADSRGTTAITVTTVASATAPTAPFAPDRRLDAGLGAALVLLLGVLAVVAREVLDTRVRDQDDVLDISDVPVLASVAPRTSRTPWFGTENGERVESIRRLRANLRFLSDGGGPQQFVIASAADGDGPALAVELGRAVADAETRVLLLEGDLRTPVLARSLGLAPAAGVAGVVLDRVPLDRVVQRWGPEGLHVLAAGAASANADELVGSTSLQRLLGELRTRYDIVLVTAPAVLAAADAAVLSARVDGILVVAESPATTRRQLQDALRDLEMVRARVLGVVIDRTGRPGRRGARRRPTATAARRPARTTPEITVREGSADDPVRGGRP